MQWVAGTIIIAGEGIEIYIIHNYYEFFCNRIYR